MSEISLRRPVQFLSSNSKTSSFWVLAQYLRPTLRHLPVERYLGPEEFRKLRGEAEAMGFLHVSSGPLVRSSFHAETVLGVLGAAGRTP